MGKRLYCGNLPFSATADDVRAVFEEGGRTVTDVHIVTDRETGRSRGFAFVELATEEQAEEAIRAADGRMLGGRPLAVKEARERTPRPGGGFGEGPRGPRPGGRPGFRGGPGGPAVERRPAGFGGDRGYGGERGFGGDRGGWGGDRGFGGRGGGFDRGHDRGGRGGYRGGYEPEPFPMEPDFSAVEPDYGSMQPEEYGPPEDIDYRERGDRGKRGRDRRGGRRRGMPDLDSDW